ncbi:M20 family peptidase [Clostridium fermenticellae]|uniref:M20 family peptidase n=1 Tax=Clostridium fermenticellae TaxID=2068654 RepID=A0A386H1X0_9CLOT|nr:M20 family metallopeptidase [Clostridium fermenticellae]AYD39682.1 M20 family peptidase [Clostridium fermenticellae]
MQEYISFLKELIKIDSVNPPGNEEKVARVIADKLKKNSIECKMRSLDSNRAYLIARLKGKGHKKSLIYCGHMDTVPPGDISWKHQPFTAEEVNNCIYGRGASDMKSGLAALTIAMIEIAKSKVTLEGDLVLAATAGEEVDSLGARVMIEDGILNDAGAMIIGEPTNNKIVVAHKGALWIEIISYGKTAHGSMPDQGINAIDNMNIFINTLNNKFKFKYREDILLGIPTINLGTINGGVRTNVVPDMCSLKIDIRTVPGQKHQEILHDIEVLLKDIEQNSNAKFDLKVLNDLASVGTSKEDSLIKLALSAANELFNSEHDVNGVRYYTDASVFVPKLGNNLPVLFYGPGNETMAHKPDEYVEIDKYLDSIKFYRELAVRYLR